MSCRNIIFCSFWDLTIMRDLHYSSARMGRRFKRTYPDLATYFAQSGETQAAFAARVNRSQSWVSRVRSGETEPNLTDALMICREAGVPLESLIKRQPVTSGT